MMYGPHSQRIEFIRDRHIPLLTSQRADTIIGHYRRSDQDATAAQNRALGAARMWGVEEQVVAASEGLRRSIWGVVWDSTWVDAWSLQWIVARAAVGITTSDLIGLADYSIEDYITLVSPWTVGFTDLPLPYTEGMAA